jgi:hypothetical protein
MFKPLESDLKRHLARVSAPDELWERVCERRAPRHRELYVPVWAAAAVLLSLGAGSLAAWRGASIGSQHSHELQIKPAAEYYSHNLPKAEACLQCHTI